ncbi:hypothetical protein [Amaricoccus solimangrovi]|uniref:Uncharacterized protein n=1 Tax=Amaricoccus solimangrovi TaxID=2589815 RepID=A0A501WCV0_9RHOB|nr:hypothetical protein [Amaricoccus solimangrovi]TPE47218.1 hypothetical protein FJM51_20395 [Amaricoccus solimangrovi]
MDVTYPDKMPGSSVTSADLNQIKAVVNSKVGSEQVGAPNGILSADDQGRLPADALPSGEEIAAQIPMESIISGLSDRPAGSRLPAAALDPDSGFAIVQVATATLSEGARFRLVASSLGEGVLFAVPEIDETNPDLPEQMVAGTHFSTPVQYEDGYRIDLNIIEAPASVEAVTSYQVVFDGAATVLSIPASAPMPFSVVFTPESYADIWQWGVPTWNATFRIRAISAAGPGGFSDAVIIPIDQDDSYFITGDDWGFVEERDTVEAGGVVGLPRTTVAPSRVVPAGVELRCYMGSLPYAPANYDAIHAATVAAAPGDSLLGSEASSAGETVFGILLYREADALRWHPASGQKSFTTQGLVQSGAPALVTAPEIAGPGKIGSAHTASSGVWTNSPTAYDFQALRDGADIPGAETSSYTPTAEDDLTSLSYRVTARNGAGETSVYTAGIPITYPTPALVGSLADQSFEQRSGAYESVSVAGLFSGSDLTIEVNGPTAGGVSLVTYSAETDTLSIALSSIVSDAEVVVRARNSGGFDETSFQLDIHNVTPATVPEVRGVGGSNTAGSADFTNYLTDDMILAAVRRNSNDAFPVPDLSGTFAGQYLWNVLFLGGSSGQYMAVCWRRADSDGEDGDLGDWGDGRPTYISIPGVDWSNPLGANTLEGTPDALTWQSFAKRLDHPGLTLEGANSIVLDLAFIASAQTSQAPGLRPDATLVVQNAAGGIRKTISRSTAAPATAWAAADDVDHTYTGAASGAQFVAAIEIRGPETASGLSWPDDVPKADWNVVEVTDLTEASAQGFADESGHLKFTTAAGITVATTVAGEDFTLIREIMGDEVAAPSATAAAVTAGLTWYSSGRRPVGGRAYPRLWWLHGASGQMRLAGSIAPFDIVGLDDPGVTALPIPFATGTGTNQARSSFYDPKSQFAAIRAGYSGNIGTRGSIGPVASYAALAGDSALRSLGLGWLRSCLTGAACPAMVASYAAQHESAFPTAALFAKLDANQWGDLSSADKNKVTLLTKAGMIAGATVGKEGSDTLRDMLGYANPTNLTSMPNFRCPPRFLVTIGACFFGSAQAGDAVLKSMSNTAAVQDFYDELVDAGLTNTAGSFKPARPSGAPTYADIVRKCSNWATGDASTGGALSLLDLTGIVCREVDYMFSRVCKTAAATKNGLNYNGRGKIKGSATAALNALVGQIGMGVELEGQDAEGLRSSMEYMMGAVRAGVYAFMAGLASGVMSRTDPRVIATAARLKVAVAWMREITRDKVGWLDFAHDTRNDGDGSNSKDWTWSQRVVGSSYLYGVLPWFALADCAVCYVEGTAPVDVPASYYTS